MYAFKETYNDILNIYLFKILSLTIKTWWNNPQFSINSMREAREKRKLQEEKYNKFIIKDKSNE